MRRFDSRAQGPASWVLAVVVVLGLLYALFPRVARAGNGARASEANEGAGRVVALVGGPRPVFGAAPADPPRARATFVYLHGVCGLTVNGCGHFAGAPGWLVCPQANAPCAGGGSSWSGSVEDKLAVVDGALDAAHARWPESEGFPVVLVGFSQGAYVAVDVASARPGRFAGLLLLGADTEHAVDRLRASRVARVGLACGAYDMMFPRMRGTPRALGAGVDARFASLGAVGHTYAAADGTDDALTSLLAWVAPGGEPAAI
jgi:pimeloyl-ACP methyl ester carboxylesterase